MFNPYWDVSTGTDTFRHQTPTEAEEIDREDIEEHPFFLPFANAKFHDPALGSAEALKYTEVSRALAEALPATSFAAGSNSVEAFGDLRNIDLNSEGIRLNGWPTFRTGDDKEELRGWLHSDIRDMAYIYTFVTFERFVDIGGLKNE